MALADQRKRVKAPAVSPARTVASVNPNVTLVIAVSATPEFPAVVALLLLLLPEDAADPVATDVCDTPPE